MEVQAVTLRNILIHLTYRILYLTGDPNPWFTGQGMKPREHRIWERYPLVNLLVQFKRRMEHYTGRPRWTYAEMIPHAKVTYDLDTGSLIRWNALMRRYEPIL